MPYGKTGINKCPKAVSTAAAIYNIFQKNAYYLFTHLPPLTQLYTAKKPAAETPPDPQKLTLSKESVKKICAPTSRGIARKQPNFQVFILLRWFLFNNLLHKASHSIQYLQQLICFFMNPVVNYEFDYTNKLILASDYSR